MMIDSSYDFLRFYLLSNILTPKISTTEYSLEGYIVKESFSVSFILSAADLCTSDQHNRLGLLFLMLSFKNIIGMFNNFSGPCTKTESRKQIILRLVIIQPANLINIVKVRIINSTFFSISSGLICTYI